MHLSLLDGLFLSVLENVYVVCEYRGLLEFSSLKNEEFSFHIIICFFYEHLLLCMARPFSAVIIAFPTEIQKSSNNILLRCLASRARSSSEIFIYLVTAYIYDTC